MDGHVVCGEENSRFVLSVIQSGLSLPSEQCTMLQHPRVVVEDA